MCNIYLCGFFVCMCATPYKLFSVFLQLSLVVSSFYVLSGDGWDGHIIGCHPSLKTSGCLTLFSTFSFLSVIPSVFLPSSLVSLSLFRNSVSHLLHSASCFSLFLFFNLFCFCPFSFELSAFHSSFSVCHMSPWCNLPSGSLKEKI